MKSFTYLILLFIVLPVCAQDIDHVSLRVHYAVTFKRFKPAKGVSQDERILDIGRKGISKFYSLWETKAENIQDSVISRGGSFQDVQNALGRCPYPRSYSNYIVFKNYPQKKRITFTEKDFKSYIYEEEIEKPVWEIIIADTLIAGYTCQQARTHFRGRSWKVWFTPLIPISEGPWKLCGLPGLILFAKDAKNDFLFSCIEIKKGNDQVINFKKRKYVKCTREDLKQNAIKMAKDPMAYIQQHFSEKMNPGYGPDGKPLVYQEREAVLLEY